MGLAHIEEILYFADRYVPSNSKWKVDHEYEQFISGVPEKDRGEPYLPSNMSEPIILKRLTDYDRPNPTISQIQMLQLQTANDWAKEHFSRGMDKPSLQPDSLSTTIERFLAEEDSRHRSPGWPYNKRYQTKAQALADPKFVDELDKFVQSLDTEQPKYEPFALTLKSELLRQTKVDNNDTRMFMSAPITHHMACYQLFGKLQGHIMEKQLTWCTAGMVFQFGGWNAFLNKFPKFAKFFGVDIKGMDMCVSTEFWECFLEWLKSILDEKYHLRIVNLLTMALHCVMVTPHGRIFIKHTGNPSGWYLTLLINSYVIYLLIAMLWITRFWGDSEMLKRSHFENNMLSGICGDDSLISVFGQHYKWCTNAFIEDLWNSLGYKVKSLEMSDRIEDLEYCGAHSMLYKDVLVRVPRTEKFISSLRWVHNLDPCFRYQRACSLYYEVFILPTYRDLIGRFLAYLERKYEAALGTLPSSRLTSAEIETLHTGIGSDTLITRLRDELIYEGRFSTIYSSPLNNSHTRRTTPSPHIQLQSRITITDMPNNKQKKGKAPKRAAAAVVVRVNRAAPKKGKNAKKKAARRSTGNQLHLSPCAMEYAHSLLNPCSAPPCCMPSIGAIASRKLKIFARGTLATSTVPSNAGNGFIICAPSIGMSNSNPWVLVSDTPWAGPTLPGTTGTGILAFASNSDYTTATFGPNAFRTVSLCLRVRYIGTELNRGGAIFGLCEPDHVSLVGKDLSGMRQYAQCAETKVGDGWTEIVYTGPVNPTEFEYTSTAINGSIVPNSQYMMAIWIRSAQIGSLFDWEVWGNYEVIGPNIQGKTPSYADAVGLDAVNNGTMSAASTGQVGHHASSGFLTKAVKAMGTAAQMAITHIGNSDAISVDNLIKVMLPKLTNRVAPAMARAIM